MVDVAATTVGGVGVGMGCRPHTDAIVSLLPHNLKACPLDMKNCLPNLSSGSLDLCIPR